MTLPTLHIPTLILQAELAALNKHKSIKIAATELGIHPRTLTFHMRNNNIQKIKLTKEYIVSPRTACPSAKQNP